jgi:hypothetical protein
MNRVDQERLADIERVLKIATDELSSLGFPDAGELDQAKHAGISGHLQD